jgi:hypothetical protein
MINPSKKTIVRKPTSCKTQAGTSTSRQEKRPRKPASAQPIASGRAAHPKAKATHRITKQDQLAALLLRDEGATLGQMIAATGWLPHTTRAALTGLRKKGYAIDGDKVDRVRTYRAATPE